MLVAFRRRGDRPGAPTAMFGTSLAVALFATVLLTAAEKRPAGAATWGGWCSG